MSACQEYSFSVEAQVKNDINYSASEYFDITLHTSHAHLKPGCV